MNLQAFLITFREAMEAILIVGVILAYVRKIGETRWNKWVWTGVGLAVLASYGVALLFQVAMTGYESMSNQNYLRIGIMLISTGLLTHMILFMGKQSKAYQKSVESKVATILTAGGALNMIVHSFLVTLREGVRRCSSSRRSAAATSSRPWPAGARSEASSARPSSGSSC